MRAILTLATLALCAPSAHAFCGFYVGSADDTLLNQATQVVLMREGDRTVLSMQNDYQGPPKGFALVVPVPEVLQKDDVKVLPRDVFARVDRLAAPRLVQYWEQDPCPPKRAGSGLGGLGSAGIGMGGGGSGYGRGVGGRPKVRIEAQFAVGEYEIVILSADDSAALDTWLRTHDYAIPAGAEAALRPYVAQGMKFFVAKVDPSKVAFTDGRAVLSPLRVSYRSKTFSLPVRLGLLNSGGAQDLVVHVLARDTRYEVSNHPNVTIPTNLDVTEATAAQFPAFYAALFDRTLEKHPGAVVTEYAWQATKCDPCPGPVLSVRDLVTLGADVAIDGGVSAVTTGTDLQELPPKVTSGLDQKIIRRVVRRHRNEVRYCIERAQNQTPGPMTGAIEAEITITPEGKVASETKVTGALPEPPRRCIEQRLRRWRFPEPKGGQPVRARLRWHARPGTQRLMGRNPLNRFVLTRLHARYGKDTLGEDLLFAPANAIVGGREVRRARVAPPPPPAPMPPAPAPAPATPTSQSSGQGGALAAILGQGLGRAGMGTVGMGTVGIGLSGTGRGSWGPAPIAPGDLESGATEAAFNNFQARYAIRHPWTGKIACEKPIRNVWGGPPSDRDAAPASAHGLPPLQRAVDLVKAVPAGIPELGVPAQR